MKPRVVLGITGASGVVYGLRMLDQLSRRCETVHLILSRNVVDVIRAESDRVVSDDPTVEEMLGRPASNVVICGRSDYFTPPASGSYRHDGMVIAPCSMGTAARIAGGISNDLMTRSADVCLKERRRLVLMVRETPLSLVHLRNLTAVTEAGATVLPAAPAFYGRPATLEEAVDTVVARALQALGMDQDLVRPWAQ
ncbi:MAG: UbiX family flavin prenyltransferase [Armatimonadaceae bacterium]|jgi:4-hydroxy-3-polyprenylbenzoate decarboxylase